MKMTSVSGLQTTKVLRGVLLSTKERLFYLLDNNTNKYDIDYSPLALSNHLSHGLVAIWGLGGSEEHLNKFYNEYTTGDLYNHYHLDPAHPIEEVPKSRKDVLENWRGKYHNFTGILRFFEEENTRLKNTYPDRCSWKQLVASYAPYLSEGVSGQAFHGVIQLGYGIEVEKEKTILEGLAYWLYSYRSLGPSKKPTKEFTTDEFGVRDVVEMVSYVRHEVLKKGKLDESITRETRFMPQTKAATEAYRSIIDDTQLGLLQLLSKNRPHDANKVYEVAERKVTDAIYKTLASSNNDFFVTHLVTALRALRKVLSVIDEISDPLEGDDADFLNVHERSSLLLKGRMLDDFWQAAIAAYITQGYPEVKEKLFTLEDWSTLPEWPAIIEKLLDGVEKKDEHDAKTVFVCHQDDLEEYFVDQSNNSKSVDEQRKDASHLLRLVAARKAGLLPWPPITAEKR